MNMNTPQHAERRANGATPWDTVAMPVASVVLTARHPVI